MMGGTYEAAGAFESRPFRSARVSRSGPPGILDARGKTEAGEDQSGSRRSHRALGQRFGGFQSVPRRRKETFGGIRLYRRDRPGSTQRRDVQREMRTAKNLGRHDKDGQRRRPS